MKNAYVILAIALLMTSCQKSKQVSKIVGNNWLIGKWENKSNQGNLLEIWKKTNDSLFIGESYFINDNDTLHSEKMALKQNGDNLFYVSTIKGQNNDQPITFNHKIEIEKQLVFENFKNEYPQKIVYKPIAKERILIVVSGMQQDKPSTSQYLMKKTN